MSQLTIHEASVPVFERYLGQLSSMLTLGERFATTHGLHPSALLLARLSPSMYPLAKQVQIAAGFALRACAPLAGLAVPQWDEPDESFEGLQLRIADTLRFLQQLSPEQMAGAEDRPLNSLAGLEAVELPGRSFLTQYALPNFFFHVTTAYAILRHLGVGLGKGDYDGFHVYAR
jgi:hypothetical protein